MKAHQKIVTAGLGVAFIITVHLAMQGCSAPTNTIAGLTTPQSTISGSNYVYYVNPDSRRLETGDSHITAGDIIRSGDNFEIDLDFGFLRYLQAVDPYVVVYSEVWMGKPPRPVDGQKTLNKVLLIKEGLTQNARLPEHTGHILDPVTLTGDDVDVSLTLKVVVLSKNDNKETVRLVEGLAGAVGTAMPQFSLLAGTAAAAMSAFISQNRDKIEFEHTFTFNPRHRLPESIVRHNLTNVRDAHDVSGILRESQIVILKGESGYRVVPYHTWYYYLWPFNWLGQYTDMPSRRFEKDEHAKYDTLGEAVRFPVSIVKSFFVDVPEYPQTVPSVVKPFFWLGDLLGIPLQDWFGIERRRATFPYRLGVDGSYIVRCKSKLDTLKFAWNDKNTQEQKDDKKERILVEEAMSSCQPAHNPTEDGALYYSEKTHLALRIRKTDETRGTFSALMGESKEYLKLIQDVTTTRGEAKATQEQLTTEAFARAERMFRVERATNEIREEATKGALVPLTAEFFSSHNIASKDKPSLIKEAVEAQIRSSTKELFEFSLNQFKAIDIDKEQAKAKAAFEFVIEKTLEVQKRRWNTSEVEPNDRSKWEEGWSRVVDQIARELRRLGCTETNNDCFDKVKWSQLETSSLATVSIANSEIQEGNSGTSAITFIVKIDPPVEDDVTFDATIQELTGANAAKVGTDYEVTAMKVVTLTKENPRGAIEVKIKGDTDPELDEVFSAVLSNLKSKKGRVVFGQSEAKGKIIDDDAPIISIESCSDIKDGDTLKEKQFMVKSDRTHTNQITMRYGTVSKPTDPQPAEEKKDYVPVKEGSLVLPPAETSKPIRINVMANEQRTTEKKFYLQLYGLLGSEKFTGGSSILEQECAIAKSK